MSFSCFDDYLAFWTYVYPLVPDVLDQHYLLVQECPDKIVCR